MKSGGWLSVILVVFVLLVGSTVHGAVPDRISYQGVLNDQGGAPVNGTVSFTFGLYTVAEGGTAVWSEVQSVQVSNGLFSVELGSETPLPASVFLNPELYLGVRAGADQEMTPRQRVVSAAYVITAEQLSHQIQGEELARESVWPVHAGRNNTIVSYYAQTGGSSVQSFPMPADKKFIITDVSHHCISTDGAADWWSSCVVQYVSGGVTTVLYKSNSHDKSTSSTRGLGHHDTFRSGLPVPAGATLQIGRFDGSVTPSSCIVAGFEIPAN